MARQDEYLQSRHTQYYPPYIIPDEVSEAVAVPWLLVVDTGPSGPFNPIAISGPFTPIAMPWSLVIDGGGSGPLGVTGGMGSLPSVEALDMSSLMVVVVVVGITPLESLLPLYSA